jgi:small-conductance mechanosensitive channel
VDFAWNAWPWWGMPLLSSVLAIAIAYGVGYLVRAIVASRLTKLVKFTVVNWDDVVLDELLRRIPFWSLLIGLWLAVAKWPLSPSTHTLATRVISALGVASVTLAVAAMSSKLVRAYGPRLNPAAPVSALSQNLVRILVTMLGVLVIIRSFGYDITPMLTALGVGGLAVALALQEPLSNLFAGVFVTFAGQLRIGDYVKLDAGAEGYIADFNWHSTRIHAPAGNLIIVPNAKVAQAIATNFSHPQKDMGFGVDLGVDYASDLQHVERVTTDVAREVMRDVPGGMPDFEPSIRYHALGDYSVRFSVNLRAREFVDQPLLKHEFVKRLHARFQAEGIVVPFPVQALTTRDPLSVSVKSTT